ncbi:MAG TPA: hypothetical protein ENI23_04305 [bacterium]|nr:hypothetical protein [bacterium]
MRKNLILGLLVFSVMVLIVSVATPDLNAKPLKAKGVKHRTVTIPKHAIEVVPGKAFWLGTAKDKGRLVEGYAIIHHKKGFAKPTGCNNDGKCQGWEDQSCEDCSNGGGGTETSNCFSFLAKGAKWKTVEDYIVDPTNSRRLNAQGIRNNLASDIAKWENAAFFNIIGERVSGTVDGADLISPDDKNEVFFGNVDSPGAIAVTVVWGIFRGPPRGRELVEWDQVYDDKDFDWSLSGEAGKMDFENIATHELGHTFGLDDLFTEGCSEETMYGFAALGETNKRILGNGDSAGVFELYN